MYRGLRFAVRAILISENKLLLVNAYKPEDQKNLWCAPGGGLDAHSSLHENLKREVFEETGYNIEVGKVAMVNEFHDPKVPFHQVEIFFRSQIVGSPVKTPWEDPAGVVMESRFFCEKECSLISLKPSKLLEVAFDNHSEVAYDPLELMI